MALSERKNIVIENNDGIPSKVVKDHEWPNALPDAINHVVITYLCPSIDEIKELDKHFKKLKNETIAPFSNAVKSKIVPLLNKPTLAQIYESKPSKSKWDFVENKVAEVLDNLIEKMNHIPADKQLEFLCSIHEEDWKKKEKSYFKQIKTSLKVLYDSFKGDERDIRNIDKRKVFKTYIAQVIFEKLNSFISDTISYPNQTQAGTVRINLKKNQEVKVVEDAKQLFDQENTLFNQNRRKVVLLFRSSFVLTAAGLCFFLFGMMKNHSYSKAFNYLGLALCVFGYLVSERTLTYRELRDRHFNQARILGSAIQHSSFQPQSEAKSNNNSLTGSILPAGEQADNKEDEETTLRQNFLRQRRR